MPLLMVLLALLLPRLTILALWLLTHWFDDMFRAALWPVLGFIFLPLSLLWYSVVQHWFGGEWGLAAWMGMALALLIDLSPAARRRSRTSVEG